MSVPRWFNPRAMFLIPLASVLLIGVACSSSVQPEPTATTAPVPTAAPAMAETPEAMGEQMGEPTPTPFATARPTFTPVPVEAISGKDTIILVTSEDG